jgi:hypothetical protein
VRLSDRPNPPCFRLHPVPPPTPARRRCPPFPRRPPSPRRGGILRVRYATSCSTDCSCHRTRSMAPRPLLPSFMCMLAECSGASVPRHAVVLRPSPRRPGG